MPGKIALGFHIIGFAKANQPTRPLRAHPLGCANHNGAFEYYRIHPKGRQDDCPSPQFKRLKSQGMTTSAVASRPDAAEAPSLRSFLAELPEDEVLRITGSIDLDFLPTALVLELEKRHRTRWS